MQLTKLLKKEVALDGFLGTQPFCELVFVQFFVGDLRLFIRLRVA